MKRKGILCFIKNDDKVLLLKIDYGGGKVIWNGVSGYVDPGEDPKDAVAREVKEEIGVDLEVSSLEYKRDLVVSSELDLAVFVASVIRGNPEPKEASIKEVRWFERDALPWQEMLPGNKDWVPDLLK